MSRDSVFQRVRGRALPLPGDDIDTDRIMPARYLKCVTFDHLGRYIFQDERFDHNGRSKDHPVNDPRYRGARVLIVNKNFGCGSSREHAPQGILRSGFRAIVGESFAEIFFGNCTAIGLPAVTAKGTDLQNLMTYVQSQPAVEVEVDFNTMLVSFGETQIPVEMKESARQMFLEGTWDSTATLLQAQDDVRRTARRIPYLRGFHA